MRVASRQKDAVEECCGGGSTAALHNRRGWCVLECLEHTAALPHGNSAWRHGCGIGRTERGRVSCASETYRARAPAAGGARRRGITYTHADVYLLTSLLVVFRRSGRELRTRACRLSAILRKTSANCSLFQFYMHVGWTRSSCMR